MTIPRPASESGSPESGCTSRQDGVTVRDEWGARTTRSQPHVWGHTVTSWSLGSREAPAPPRRIARGPNPRRRTVEAQLTEGRQQLSFERRTKERNTAREVSRILPRRSIPGPRFWLSPALSPSETGSAIRRPSAPATISQTRDPMRACPRLEWLLTVLSAVVTREPSKRG